MTNSIVMKIFKGESKMMGFREWLIHNEKLKKAADSKTPPQEVKTPQKS